MAEEPAIINVDCLFIGMNLTKNNIKLCGLPAEA